MRILKQFELTSIVPFALLITGCGNPENVTVSINDALELGVYRIDLRESPEVLKPSDTISVSTSTEGCYLTKNIGPDYSNGKTSGAFVAIDDRSLSGKAVEIAIAARSRDGDRLQAAYSTNDVGNSGWRYFDLQQHFNTYTFEYEVPKSVNGASDFIGLATSSGTIEIQSVEIRQIK